MRFNKKSISKFEVTDEGALKSDVTVEETSIITRRHDTPSQNGLLRARPYPSKAPSYGNVNSSK